MRRLPRWLDFRPGVETFFLGRVRPLRTSWAMLGMRSRMVAGGLRSPCARKPAPSGVELETHSVFGPYIGLKPEWMPAFEPLPLLPGFSGGGGAPALRG